jgi:hypothetical protein
MVRRQDHKLLAPAEKEGVAADGERAGTQLNEGGESGLKSPSTPAFRTARSTLLARAASCISCMVRSALELFGFTSRAITPAWGTSSDSRSSRLGFSSGAMMLTPVRFPPGRARLATSPAATGSPPPKKTIGIVDVAPFAAAIAEAP